MKTSLNDFVIDFYGLGFLGEARDNKRKKYLRFENKSEKDLRKVVKKYSNLKIVKTSCEYAPEIKKLWVTLKA